MREQGSWEWNRLEHDSTAGTAFLHAKPSKLGESRKRGGDLGDQALREATVGRQGRRWKGEAAVENLRGYSGEKGLGESKLLSPRGRRDLEILGSQGSSGVGGSAQ